MWDIILGYVFCVLLGLVGLGVAGWLIVTGRVVASTDNLFLALVALLFALVCIGYLGWQIKFLLSESHRNK